MGFLPIPAIVASFCLAVSAASVDVAAEPNPPTWPSSVTVFDQTSTNIEATVNAAFAANGGHDPPNNGQFSSKRFAFLFKPGTYNDDVPVGFYTHVLGLGESPDDVVFAGQKGVYCEEGDFVFDGGALVTFWRMAENFKTNTAYKWSTGTGMMWAVSQAAPLRRVHVVDALALYEYEPPYPLAGYASGGYLSNSQVDGEVFAGSQQQWFTRNSKVGSWSGGVWNMVFTGVEGGPTMHCSNQNGTPVTTVANTPTIAEKPFISCDSTGKYSLNIPNMRTNSVGPDWSTGAKVGFEQVYVTDPSDTADVINAKLATGLHVVVTPGIYKLDTPLMLNTTGQVLLGLGMATLVAQNGNPVISVGNVDGVRVAGFLVQAGPEPTPALLQWGSPGSTYKGNPANPGIIYDVFGRVGGPDTFAVQAELIFSINNGNVIGDDMWLWRADHTVSGLVKNGDNPCTSGLSVTGNNVTMYGLAVEHTLGNLVNWSGDNGATYFYQSELPYDVTQAQYGDKGFSGYVVGNSVTSHKGYGIGVYSFFRDYNVTVESAIRAPPSLESSFVNPVSVWLNGKGTVNHIINDKGDMTSWRDPSANVAYVCAP